MKEELPKEGEFNVAPDSCRPKQIFEHLLQKPPSPSKYLELKSVKSYGLKYSVSQKYGVVSVMPVRNIKNEIIQLQYLNENETKHSMAGLSTKGGMRCLKSPLNAPIIAVVEGYATAATLQKDFDRLEVNCSVVCALDKSNMRLVCENLQEEFPSKNFLIAHDLDDIPSKPYVKQGTYHLWPTIEKIGTDFNDSFIQQGEGDLDRQLLSGVISPTKPNRIKSLKKTQKVNHSWHF